MSSQIEIETTEFIGMDASNRVGDALRDAICGILSMWISSCVNSNGGFKKLGRIMFYRGRTFYGTNFHALARSLLEDFSDEVDALLETGEVDFRPLLNKYIREVQNIRVEEMVDDY